MSGTDTTTTRLSRAQLEDILADHWSDNENSMHWKGWPEAQAARDALAYMTALEKLRNIDPNNWSVIEDLIEWVAGEVNEVLL